MTPRPAFDGIHLQAPHLIGLRALAQRIALSGAELRLPGGFVIRSIGQGQEPADIREYVPGDDFRHLHHGATARTGVLHIRTFQAERDRAAILVADLRRPMIWGTRRALRSVAAAEYLALLGWHEIETGARVGLFAFTDDRVIILRPRGRPQAMLDVIGALVRLHDRALNATSGPVSPLQDRMPQLQAFTPAGARVLFASGFDTPGAGFDSHYRRLADHADLTPIHVTDGLTEALPEGRFPVRFSDGSLGDLSSGLGQGLPAGVPANAVGLSAALPISEQIPLPSRNRRAHHG